jgi:sec-independent protein translocase protein TatB
MTSLQKDVGEALRIDDVDKPAATETPAIEPPAAATTLEAAVPEKLNGADSHAAAMEPLAITREIEPASHENAPAPPDVERDAKAS